MKLHEALPMLLLAVLVPGTLRADGSEKGALDQALDAVRADYIQADLRFIASDELAGRDTPSAGLRLAARFIRARLQRLGFEAGGDEGSFFHTYAMARTSLKVEETTVTVQNGGEEQSFAFGEDYYFWTNGIADCDVTGEVVFGGTGSEAELDGLDLDGRWVLTFEDSSLSWRERLSAMENAREKGALGIVITSPLDGRDQHAERASMMGSRVQMGQLKVVEDDEEDFFPYLYATADLGRALTANYGPDIEPGLRLGVTLRDHRTANKTEHLELENVAGLWPGSDMKEEVIVISAHYDHVGVSGEEIYNGADDNGSGTCGMLAVAEALKAYGPMRRSVLLLWVSGEEKGLRGSYAWTKSPSLPDGYRTVCNLNIDMIGRNDADYLLITPSKDHDAYNGLTRLAESVAPLEGFPELGSCDEYWRRSDHMNFSEVLGVPVAFLFSDVHEDYHQPTDTIEKIDFDKIRRVTRVIVRMLDGLQGDSLAL